MMKHHLLQEAETIKEEILEHRRKLHAHAEVGFQLNATRDYVETVLKHLGYEPKHCGRAGLVATVGRGEIAQTFLLRADMDALPIREETYLPYACSTGAMHACGHDMHTAMLLGAAKILKAHEAEIPGTIKLMFQPAEEVLEGAKDMIEHQVLENPSVDAALMIHVMTGVPIPVGTVVVSSPGVSAPAADYFTIEIQGKGCHGSTPHLGVDAITIAAHILLGLQELSSRECQVTDHAVLTVGTILGGTAPNAIADSATLKGTLRTYNEDVRSMLKRRICEIATGIAGTYRGEANVFFPSGCPTLDNNEELSDSAYRCTRNLLGENRVFTSAALSRGNSSVGGGSEDFAYISQKVPSIMLALAAGDPKDGHDHPLHHPKTTFDENVLPVGAAVYAANALEWFEGK